MINSNTVFDWIRFELAEGRSIDEVAALATAALNEVDAEIKNEAALKKEAEEKVKRALEEKQRLKEERQTKIDEILARAEERVKRYQEDDWFKTIQKEEENLRKVTQLSKSYKAPEPVEEVKEAVPEPASDTEKPDSNSLEREIIADSLINYLTDSILEVMKSDEFKKCSQFLHDIGLF